MESKNLAENFEKYRISPNVGFLLENPLTVLPVYFAQWDHIAGCMVELVETKGVRRAVDHLPKLNSEKLQSYHELRLAHLQLMTIVSGYIWSEGDDNVPRKLPHQLAVPFWNVCNRLGVQPGITHMAACLANYHPKDPSKPLCAESNMQMFSFKFIKDFGNDWFFLNTAQLELDFAPAIPAVLRGILAGKDEDKPHLYTVAKSLLEIASCVRKMEASLQEMPKYLKADVFFNGFRPFMAGFTSGKYKEWGGIVFEGVDDCKPKACTGGSAAQSSTFQTVDAFLGVQHTGESFKFLQEMRLYMPSEHSAFIRYVETTSKVRQLVLQCSNNPDHLPLVAAYNACIDAVVGFRTTHIQVVTGYIVAPKNKQFISPAENKHKSLNEVGTGGTGIMPFLKHVRDTTASYKIDPCIN